ncbi:MAG: sulfotransferase family 2 domain-containing protein [Cyanophyceae cyanobacterium]
MNNFIKSKEAQKVVIFMHIPKAAGTTLRYIIQYQANPLAVYEAYGSSSTHRQRLESLKNLSTTDRNKIKIVNAHFGFGLHEFLDRQFTYITMLRHPVERVISMYYYLCRTRPSFAKEVDLEDFVKSRVSFTKNDMTKYFSGIKLQIQMQASTRSEDDLDKDYSLTSQTLELAKRNLKEHFSVVGISSEFEETLVLLRKILGWKLPLYYRSNVSKQRPSLRNIPQSTLFLIEEYNDLDIQLYSYAQAFFRELIQQQGSSFAQEVEELKKANQTSRLKPYYTMRSYYNRITHRVYKELVGYSSSLSS